MITTWNEVQKRYEEAKINELVKKGSTYSEAEDTLAYFKENYPEIYTEEVNEFFDEIHPF